MAKRETQPGADESLRRIKRIALIALASDPLLVDRLILKGGSALDLAFGIMTRASVDLDFSLEGDFDSAERATMERHLAEALNTTFQQFGLAVFDVRFRAKPPKISADMADFWGGYGLEFKVDRATDGCPPPVDEMVRRRQAEIVGPAQRRTFAIDISCHEHCADRIEANVDGHAVRVYSPRLMVSEKLRAICQQMPEYKRLVRSPHSSPRARDFFDISQLVEHFGVRISTPQFFALTRDVFRAKRVPINLLWRIGETREFHRPDFQTVRDTVPATLPLQEFDFYVDAVVGMIDGLKAFGDV